MKIREAIERIKDHKRIHFAEEYPRAIKITEALEMAVDVLELQDEFDRPINDLYSAAVMLCMAIGMNENGCKNCPVTLFNYDKRTEYEKCSLHEPCVVNLFKWVKEEALKKNIK